MVVVGTKYDKELKEKVFYVREVDSYSHKTVTSLSVDWVDGVFTLTAIVGNLIGKGFVKFYRDGVEVGEQYVSKTATLLLQSETNTGVFVAKFMGNSDCLKSQSDEVSYSPLPTPAFTLTASKNSGVVGDTVSFTASLPSDATGTITYTVDGASYTKNVGETFSYKFNKEGSFPVTAVYSGDSNYQGNTASVSVVIKIGVVFSGSASSTNVYVGETVTISGTLKTSSGSPLSNVKIVDGAGVVKATTDSGGAWSFTNVESVAGTGGWVLTPELDWGKYVKPSDVIISITVRKKDTVLTGSVDKSSVTIGENVLCTLYLKDSQNNPLANKTVYIADWSKTTNDDGRVMFNYANPTSGVATGVFKFDGDNSYNGASVTVSWTVNKKPVTLTVNYSKTSAVVGETVTLTATVKSGGVNINEGQVDFGDGVLVGVSNGTAVKTVTKTTPQSITFTPSYKGTSVYSTATASSLTITWIEEQVTPEISISASTLIGEVGDDLPIQLQSNLKNTALTVLLNDAEVADSVTTDNTGNASFNYNCNGAGDVEVKVKYVNGANVYYSNILLIEDCVKYGFKASDTWINPTGYSATNTVVEGVFTSVSDSSNGDSILQLDITGDFIITYDAQWQASTRCGVGAKDTTRTTHFDSGTDTNFKTQKYIYWNGSKETETHYSKSTQNTYCPCKIIKSDGHLKGYMNDTLVCDLNYAWISQCSAWNLHTTIWGSGRTINIKNLKIKPYSE